MKSELTASQLKSLLTLALGGASRAETLYADLIERAIAADTRVEDLVALKDSAKAMAREADDRDHREAAQLLYHTAVAAAFVRHNAKISGRPMIKQLALYRELASTLPDGALRALFDAVATRIAAEAPDAAI